MFGKVNYLNALTVLDFVAKNELGVVELLQKVVGVALIVR